MADELAANPREVVVPLGDGQRVRTLRAGSRTMFIVEMELSELQWVEVDDGRAVLDVHPGGRFLTATGTPDAFLRWARFLEAAAPGVPVAGLEMRRIASHPLIVAGRPARIRRGG